MRMDTYVALVAEAKNIKKADKQRCLESEMK